MQYNNVGCENYQFFETIQFQEGPSFDRVFFGTNFKVQISINKDALKRTENNYF